MSRLLLIPLAFTLSACLSGPNYEKPDLTPVMPAQWRWQPAVPKDDLPRGDWWKAFHDAELNRLEERALANNQSLKAAVSRVDQARASARGTSADFFPDIRIKSNSKRERTSGNLPTPVPVSIPSSHINTFRDVLDLSY